MWDSYGASAQGVNGQGIKGRPFHLISRQKSSCAMRSTRRSEKVQNKYSKKRHTSRMKFKEALLHLNMARDLFALPVHCVILVGILVRERLIKHLVDPLRVRLCCNPSVPDILGYDHVATVLLVGHVELAPTHEYDLEEGYGKTISPQRSSTLHWVGNM